MRRTSIKSLRVPQLYLGVLVVLIMLGGLLVEQGLGLKYYDRFGPGAGFFPVWIGGMLIVVALVAMIPTITELRSSQALVFPPGSSAWRVIVMLASLAILWWAVDMFGFRLAVLVYMLTIPILIARLPLIIIVPTALAASFGAAYVFETWLLVRLPEAQFPALAALGL